MAKTLIAIPNWDGRDLLETCLASVFALDGQDVAVVVVDNGSTDGSVDYLRRAFPQVTVIENTENRGFAAATNQAIRRIDAEFVATLNNDTEVDPDWLAALVETMESDPTAGMVASRIVLAERPGVIESAGIAVDRAGIAWERRGDQVSDEGAEAHCEVFGPSAAAALYRRSMLDEIGLFDEDFFAYLEDVDLAWRAQWAGWKCPYEPNAIVRHVHSATGARDPVRKRWLLGRNKLWTVMKNYPMPQLVWYGPLVLGYDLMALAYGVRLRGGRGAATGRLQALSGMGAMIRKRRERICRLSPAEMMAHLAPVAKPSTVARRYPQLVS